MTPTVTPPFRIREGSRGRLFIVSSDFPREQWICEVNPYNGSGPALARMILARLNYYDTLTAHATQLLEALSRDHVTLSLVEASHVQEMRLALRRAAVATRGEAVL